MTGSWKGRGNQYIQFTRVLYCKLPTNGKQLPAFPLKAMTGIEPRPQSPNPHKERLRVKSYIALSRDHKNRKTRAFREQISLVKPIISYNAL